MSMERKRRPTLDRLPIIFNDEIQYHGTDLPDHRLCSFDSFSKIELFINDEASKDERESLLRGPTIHDAIRGKDMMNLKWLLLRSTKVAWQVEAKSMEYRPKDSLFEILRFRTVRILAGNSKNMPFQSVGSLPLSLAQGENDMLRILMCMTILLVNDRISTADIVDILDRLMDKPGFFTSMTKARAVPVDAKLMNHTRIQDSVLIPLIELCEVDVSVMRVSAIVLDQDLCNLVAGNLAVPELAHSPGESVDSVHAEASSSRNEELPSDDKAKGVEGRAEEGEVDAEGEVDLNFAMGAVEKYNNEESQ